MLEPAMHDTRVISKNSTTLHSEGDHRATGGAKNAKANKTTKKTNKKRKKVKTDDQKAHMPASASLLPLHPDKPKVAKNSLHRTKESTGTISERSPHTRSLQVMMQRADSDLQHLLMHGDPLIKVFYGHVSEAAGHVDGFCELFKRKHMTAITTRPMIVRILDDLQTSVTKPILTRKRPTVPTSYPNAGNTMFVREIRVLLQSWVIIGCLVDDEFAEYFAASAKQRSGYVNWHNHCKKYAVDFFSGYGHCTTDIGALPVSWKLYKLVEYLASIYLVMVPQQ